MKFRELFLNTVHSRKIQWLNRAGQCKSCVSETEWIYLAKLEILRGAKNIGFFFRFKLTIALITGTSY